MKGRAAEYVYKSAEIKLKDIDSGKGIVKGLFAKYSNLDNDGDIIYPGAARKTISERGPAGSDRIKHLRNHNIFEIVGKILELEDTQDGVEFASKISKSSIGRDVLIQYQEEILREHSIGFIGIKSEPNEDTGGRHYYEIKMYEGSTVTWGANEMALVQAVKGTNNRDGFIEKIQRMQKVLHDGNLTDETCILFEIQLKQLQQYLMDSLQPSQDTEPNLEKIVGEAFRNGLVLN